MMLDTKSTFDDLVVKYSGDEKQAQRILGNRFYKNISGALSGTQEYMAMEKLYELDQSSSFDLVVVDTPPTRHALDFLDAPRRLTRFLDHRLYRILMAPTRGFVKAVNVAAQAFVRTVSKVVGGEVVEDAITFFSAFQGMEEGFKNRAKAVFELLSDSRTAFVLVASPRRDTVQEAEFFARRLGEAGISVRALIVNRMHPRFGRGLGEATRERARTLGRDVFGFAVRELGVVPAGGLPRGGAPERAGRARVPGAGGAGAVDAHRRPRFIRAGGGGRAPILVTMGNAWGRLKWAATFLLLAQVAHTVAAFWGPKLPEGSTEGGLGEPLGLLALIASAVSIGGAARRSSWAPWLGAVTGLSVAVGFVLYHGIPVHSWFTNTYWRSGVSFVDWAMVALCVAAGVWAFVVGRSLWTGASSPAVSVA